MTAWRRAYLLPTFSLRLLLGAVLSSAALAWVLPMQAQAAFGGELFHFASMSTQTPPGVCVLEANVPQGATLVVIGAEDGNDYHITNVTDSQGNSYRQDLYYHNTEYQPTEQSIWSAQVTHALTIKDTVSITWSAPTTEYRSYAISVIYLTGVAADEIGGKAENNAYMRSEVVELPGKVTHGNAIVVGMLAANNFNWKIGSGWTLYRTEAVNIYYHFFYKVLKSVGLADPGGTGPATNTYSGVWVAFAGNSSGQ